MRKSRPSRSKKLNVNAQIESCRAMRRKLLDMMWVTDCDSADYAKIRDAYRSISARFDALMFPGVK